uniref:Uncharacterized protein n=1 Tax=Panagrellus redivivus TaxID=6233 RepID=A0A7E5A1C9_PANRE
MNALDYGTRCRLRELASPGEVYDLQTAAPYFDGLKPIQKITLTYHSARLMKSDSNDIILVFDGHGLGDFTGNNFYIVYLRLRVRGLSLADTQKMHYHLRFQGRFIIIDECQVASSFLDAISVSTESCIGYLTFDKCTFDSSVTPEYFCTNFKELESPWFKNGCPFKRNWIDAFVDADITNLKFLSFVYATMEILKIEQKKLMEFFKKQKNDFVLVMEFQNIENAEHIQPEMLDPEKRPGS